MNRKLRNWGIAAAVLAALALALMLSWRWALTNHGPALLSWADRQFGGNTGYRIALADGHYGPDPAQRVEVIVPEGQAGAPRPVLIFIHGGSWSFGDPRDYRFIGRQFARRGFVVVNAGYRLGAAGRFPVMLQDSAAAAAWTAANAARFGGDPTGACLMGHSAGAYNVMMLGLERQWLGRAAIGEGYVRGVVGLAGPYDFYPFVSESTKAAFGQAADPAETQPIRFARGDAPPLLLLTGDADTTVKPRNTLALAKALENLGARPQVVLLPGLTHNDPVRLLGAPFNSDTRVIDPVVGFLSAHCGASAPVQAQSR